MSGRPSAHAGLRAATTYLATLAIAFGLSSAFAVPAGADPPAPAPTPTSITADPPSDTPPPEPDPPGSAPAASSEPAPRAAEEPAQQPEFEVSGEFDKASYRTGELIGFMLTIKNVGDVRAVEVRLTQFFDEPTDLQVVNPPGWGPLDRPPGVTIEPGATFQISVSGNVRNLDADLATVRGFVQHSVIGGSQSFAFSAPVTKVFGHVAGTVFGDKNGNGNLDQGEELPGITLTLTYVTTGANRYTATSGANGKIDFGQIPAARYYIGGEVINGWLFPFDILEIDDSDENDNLLIRGAPPLNGALHATMKFTKDTYQPGELAHVTVTLRNSGAIPLVGIVASCNRGGFAHGLTGDGPGWGDLAFFSDGVTLAPGETRTFDVSEKVPDAAINVGHVFVGCGFGYREVDIDNHAGAGDEAAVPGGGATLVGDVLYFPNEEPQQAVAGVRVVLVDDRDCPIVGERTTDGNGHFEFHDLTPGTGYQIYVLPPAGWKVRGANPSKVDIFGPADQPRRIFIGVEPGDAPLPDVPEQPASCDPTTAPVPTSETPAPQARSTSGLASTGASVAGLGVVGLLALLLGSVALFTARRRRPTS